MRYDYETKTWHVAIPAEGPVDAQWRVGLALYGSYETALVEYRGEAKAFPWHVREAEAAWKAEVTS